MATTRFYLDRRTVKKDNTSVLRLSVSHKGKNVLVNTGISLTILQWSGERVINHPRKAQLNLMLEQKKLAMDMELLRLESEGLLDAMDREDMRRVAEGVMHGEVEMQPRIAWRGDYGRETINYGRAGMKPAPMGAFMRAMEDARDKHLKENTRAIYQQTINALRRYCPEVDELGFEDITKAWLERFDMFMAQTSPSRNARNIHLRNIRAAFNNAIDNDLTTVYPFRRMHLRYEPTRKRSLSVEELRRLWNYPVEEWQRRYLDCFKLIFLLIGINISDLCDLRPKDLRDGRIEYRRNKTGRLYSVKVEPEAMEIINRYRGKEYLLNYREAYRSAKDWMHKLNKNLKMIGPVKRGKKGKVEEREGEWPDLSTYWARHTWATVASGIDVPIDVIAHALGHSTGYRVTNIYIDFDMRKVDEANRRVIDRIVSDR